MSVAYAKPRAIFKTVHLFNFRLLRVFFTARFTKAVIKTSIDAVMH